MHDSWGVLLTALVGCSSRLWLMLWQTG